MLASKSQADMQQWVIKIGQAIFHANGSAQVTDLEKRFAMIEADRADEEGKLVHNIQRLEGVLELQKTRRMLVSYITERGIGELVPSLLLHHGRFLNAVRGKKEVALILSLGDTFLRVILKHMKRAKYFLEADCEDSSPDPARGADFEL